MSKNGECPLYNFYVLYQYLWFGAERHEKCLGPVASHIASNDLLVSPLPWISKNSTCFPFQVTFLTWDKTVFLCKPLLFPVASPSSPWRQDRVHLQTPGHAHTQHALHSHPVSIFSAIRSLFPFSFSAFSPPPLYLFCFSPHRASSEQTLRTRMGNPEWEAF